MNDVISDVLGNSPFASPAAPSTTVDEAHPSHRKNIEALILLKDKLTPWVLIPDPTDPANSCRELAETASRGIDGVLDRFRGATNFPEIHLPGNWPKASVAAISLARRTLVVLEHTSVKP